MDPKKYERSIPLYCPTCGGTDYSEEDGFLTCNSCNLKISQDDLIASNGENVEAHVREVQRELTTDFERELKKKLCDAFRGSNFIKIK